MGPRTADGLRLTEASAPGARRVDAAVRRVTADRLRVRGPADFRLRNADLSADGAVFGGALTLRSLPHPCMRLAEPAGAAGPARLLSLCGHARAGTGRDRPEPLPVRRPGTASCPAGDRPRPRARTAYRAANELLVPTVALASLYRRLAVAVASCNRDSARAFRHCSLEVSCRARPAPPGGGCCCP
ncbi:hypothetical protein [Actinomadura sp. 21ATH]|uniref:hypothetical protein n=1 Tax=Actinomadura sp. 21ATH TaxID=1735444 RepID=UPI0035BFA09A